MDISGDVNSVVRLFWLPISAMVLPAAYSTMLHRVTLPFGNTNSDISIPLLVTIIMTQFELLTIPRMLVQYYYKIDESRLQNCTGTSWGCDCIDTEQTGGDVTWTSNLGELDY